MVKALFDRIYSGIQQAHEDIDSAEPGGSPAYSTFLNGINPSNVKSLFSQIAAGSNVSFPGRPTRPPVIACVNPHYKDVLPRQYAHCSKKNSYTAAMWEENTQFIFLCPYFWTFPLYPSADKCPQVIPGGIRLTRTSIIETQMDVLFHELLHLYMGYPMLVPEAYDINACTSLRAHESIINVSNYDYYLGCKFFTLYDIPRLQFTLNTSLSIIVLIAGCTHFPTSRDERRPGRGLLGEDVSNLYQDDIIKAGDRTTDPFLAKVGGCPKHA